MQPGDVDGAGNDEEVFGAQLVRGLEHLAGQLEAAGALGRDRCSVSE